MILLQNHYPPLYYYTNTKQPLFARKFPLFLIIHCQISPLRAALSSPSVEMTESHFRPIDAACYPAGYG